MIALRVEAPATKAGRVGRRDVRMAKLLCRSAANWLPESSTAPDQDPGADSGRQDSGRPDSGSLRDATARLVSIAEAASDPSPADVLRELHRVERAVAVLLGTTNGDAPRAMDDIDQDVPWVSSGTLPGSTGRPALAGER